MTGPDDAERDRLNTAWGVRWQEQFDRAERAEAERDALAATLTRLQPVVDAAVEVIRQMNTRRSADLVKMRTAVESLLSDTPDTEATK